MQDLESEQNRKLQEWRKTSAPLDDWINDAETKVESYDPIAYDIENVQQQNKENEVVNPYIPNFFIQCSSFPTFLGGGIKPSLEQISYGCEKARSRHGIDDIV